MLSEEDTGKIGKKDDNFPLDLYGAVHNYYLLDITYVCRNPVELSKIGT